MSEIIEKTDPRMEALLQLLDGELPVVTVGVHDNEALRQYEGGQTVKDIAEAAEFGLGQPTRSWLRGWFDENETQIQAQLERQLTFAVERGHSREWAAERVAIWAQADIQRRIRNGIDPPNAPETVHKKGSSVPLIDTGLFRSSVLAYIEGRRV